MPAPSLLHLAKRACTANIRHIDDVGEIPYSILRPVLLKIESPQQLRTIEENSPQISGADAEIWQHFIKRDIPNWEKKPLEPKNPHNWWKVYRKLRREAEEEMKGQEAALKAALDERKTEKESHRITIVDKVMNPTKKKPRPPSYSVSRRGDRSILTFRAGSRTKTNTGKGMIDKVRREAREASLMSAGRGALATPTHLLASKGKPLPTAALAQSATDQLKSKPLASTVNQSTPRIDAGSPPDRQRLAGSKRLPPSVFLPSKKRVKT